MQDGLLPLAELGLQLLGGGGLLLDEIGLLGGIGLEIEQFALGLAFFLLVNDELEVAVDDGAGAEVVGVADGGMAEVREVAGGFAAGELGERGGAFLQLGIDLGLEL